MSNRHVHPIGPPTAEQVLERLVYDPLSGLFTRVSLARRDMPVGHLNYQGYINIWVCGRSFGAHRLAWLCHYGQWPLQNIDHINGVRDDNRIANLRDSSQAANVHNIRNVPSHNTSGFMGVADHKPTGKYRAFIRVKRRQIHLGLYDTREAAHTAYLSAKRELHSDGCTI